MVSVLLVQTLTRMVSVVLVQTLKVSMIRASPSARVLPTIIIGSASLPESLGVRMSLLRVTKLPCVSVRRSNSETTAIFQRHASS